MRISITASKNFENIYILRDIYINPTKRKTVIHKALGRMDKLMDELQLDRDGVIQWARNCAAEETEKLKEENETEVIKFDPNKMIPMNQKKDVQHFVSFSAIYLLFPPLQEHLQEYQSQV